MRILGSKHSKMPQIIKVLRESIPNFELMMHKGFYDPFAGIGSVSSEMMRYGRVVAADNYEPFYLISYKEIYPSLANSDNLYHLSMLIKMLNEQIDHLFFTEFQSSFVNFFTETYGVKYPYFTPENAKRIAIYREVIEQLLTNADLTSDQYRFLLGSLLSQVLHCSFMKIAYDTPLQRGKPYLHSAFTLPEPTFKVVRGNRSEVLHQDFKETISQIDGGILFIDPPTSGKHYSILYYVLDIILKMYTFTPVRKSGISKEQIERSLKSKWSIVGTAWNELNDIMLHNKADYVAMTYAKKGYIPEQEIERTFFRNGDRELYRKVDLGTENLYLIKKAS